MPDSRSDTACNAYIADRLHSVCYLDALDGSSVHCACISAGSCEWKAKGMETQEWFCFGGNACHLYGDEERWNCAQSEAAAVFAANSFVGGHSILERLLFWEKGALGIRWNDCGVCTDYFFVLRNCSMDGQTENTGYQQRQRCELKLHACEKEPLEKSVALDGVAESLYTAAAAVVFAADWFAVEWLLWLSAGYGALTLGLLIWFAKCGSAIEASYEGKREENFTDDDDAWLGGIVYYNKKDKRTMVTKRVGIGTTMNLATSAGKLWNGIGIAVLLIVVPICCVWMMLEEFTPIQLSVVNDVLTAEQFEVDYEIPVDEMESIAIIDEKPRWTKVSGSGMENLCKGTFRIQGEKCEVFVNPQNDIFLQIETAEETYYMSAADDAGTQEIYEIIIEALE